MGALIRKAVFPVAGLGTRFLPATKTSPKEMMPIVDKPLIQYAVEEAMAAGITDMIFVTGRTKRAIEDHFDKAYEMETELAARGKTEMLRLLQEMLPRQINCIYLRQAEPLGLGHAILCAQPVVGNEPFAVLLADDLIDADPPVLARMAEIYERLRSSVLGVEEIPLEQTRSYGVVRPVGGRGDLVAIDGIVEKPDPTDAPSNLGVVGRYILTPGIFERLARIRPGAGGELQLTDGIAALLMEEPVHAYRFNGTRYDCGSKLGYLKATVAFGLRHPETGEAFSQYLSELESARAASLPVAERENPTS